MKRLVYMMMALVVLFAANSCKDKKTAQVITPTDSLDLEEVADDSTIHESDATLPSGKADSLICHNPEKPRLQRTFSPILEVGNTREKFHKTILHNILRIIT
jgi:hypothetical protein